MISSNFRPWGSWRHALVVCLALILIVAGAASQGKKGVGEEKAVKDLQPTAAGQGVPSVTVGLKKKSGGTIIQLVKTAENGHFSFGVLPAGSYAIVIEEAPLEVMKSKNYNSSKSNTCLVDLEGASSGPVNRAWEVKPDQLKTSATRQTQNPSFGEKTVEVPFQADGKTEIKGTLKTKHDTAKNSINNVR